LVNGRASHRTQTDDNCVKLVFHLQTLSHPSYGKLYNASTSGSSCYLRQQGHRCNLRENMQCLTVSKTAGFKRPKQSNRCADRQMKFYY
jgi:hypothetical protein